MDFALILFVALSVTGLLWLWDVLVGARRRRAAVARLKESGQAEPRVLERAAREPLLVEYAKAFFPVILAVFLLRSFLVEPFRIPSSSMLPSLKVGDFILVNKYRYGLRLPIVHRKIFEIGAPERGDVMVFRFPLDPSTNYIKRVIGLPGDHVVYKDKTVYINGRPMAQTGVDSYSFVEAGERIIVANRLAEDLDGRAHDILVNGAMSQPPAEFHVPAGNYFVMGDNRDYSNDSRYWRFVPERNVVGRAFLVWFSWDTANGGGVNWARIGTSIK